MSSGQPLWILGELFRQHLNSNLTAQIGVLSPVHLTHTALADLFDDFVMRECLAEHETPLDAVFNVTPGGG